LNEVSAVVPGKVRGEISTGLIDAVLSAKSFAVGVQNDLVLARLLDSNAIIGVAKERVRTMQ
jgi:hypothetical protein